MVWGGVIGVYLLNYLFKRSSDDSKAPQKRYPQETSEPVGGPFDEIRREILRKKEERQRLEEQEAEGMEMGGPLVETIIEVDDGPSPFQVHLEEQSLRIKEKQAEAERLKAKIGRLKEDKSADKALSGSKGSAFAYSSRVSNKVRAILGNKSDIKAALITGEILAQPIALRTKESVRF